MIRSLSEELTQSYIGLDFDNPMLNLFADSLVNSCGGEKEILKLVDLIDLPWREDIVDVVVNSLYYHD